ncbi:hypothetical protein GGX14DRAFT_557394 [Mycena pura]|uniref:Chromo domain-containing protein n=1 Tax=Mycena pura TaxID=153505 RepID=A0AAD6YNG6_9AGAR|nr:hypothetical protein GGX14DRAFT_557394 [Mycena pura]
MGQPDGLRYFMRYQGRKTTWDKWVPVSRPLKDNKASRLLQVVPVTTVQRDDKTFPTLPHAAHALPLPAAPLPSPAAAPWPPRKTPPAARPRWRPLGPSGSTPVVGSALPAPKRSPCPCPCPRTPLHGSMDPIQCRPNTAHRDATLAIATHAMHPTSRTQSPTARHVTHAQEHPWRTLQVHSGALLPVTRLPLALLHAVRLCPAAARACHACVCACPPCTPHAPRGVRFLTRHSPRHSRCTLFGARCSTRCTCTQHSAVLLPTAARVAHRKRAPRRTHTGAPCMLAAYVYAHRRTLHARWGALRYYPLLHAPHTAGIRMRPAAAHACRQVPQPYTRTAQGNAVRAHAHRARRMHGGACPTLLPAARLAACSTPRRCARMQALRHTPYMHAGLCHARASPSSYVAHMAGRALRCYPPPTLYSRARRPCYAAPYACTPPHTAHLRPATARACRRCGARRTCTQGCAARAHAGHKAVFASNIWATAHGMLRATYGPSIYGIIWSFLN